MHSHMELRIRMNVTDISTMKEEGVESYNSQQQATVRVVSRYLNLHMSDMSVHTLHSACIYLLL